MIIQWQNTIQEKGYSKTYERMIQNQLNALFNHAQKIYNLKENPCKKVKQYGKIGRRQAGILDERRI